MSTKNTKPTLNHNPKKQQSRYKRYLVAAVIIIGILVIIDYIPLIGGGNAVNYIKWLQCGQRPVREIHPFAGGSGLVHYDYVPLFQMSTVFSYGEKLYCSPLEAEKNSVSASEHSQKFPHLGEDYFK